MEIVRLPRLAVSGAGVIGGGSLLAATCAWWALDGRPTGWLLVGWFAALALAGMVLPGIANQLTMTRAYLAGPAFVYALTPSGLGGLAVVVVLAGVSDLLDGTIARRFERPTRLGGALDPVVDGVFFGAAAAGLALGGAYPWWLALAVILRYLVPALAGALLVLARRPVGLNHTPLGQASTTVIAVVLGGVGLLRGLGQDSGWLVTVGAVVVPLSALATWGNLFWANRTAFAPSDEGSAR